MDSWPPPLFLGGSWSCHAQYTESGTDHIAVYQLDHTLQIHSVILLLAAEVCPTWRQILSWVSRAESCILSTIQSLCTVLLIQVGYRAATFQMQPPDWAECSAIFQSALFGCEETRRLQHQGWIEEWWTADWDVQMYTDENDHRAIAPEEALFPGWTFSWRIGSPIALFLLTLDQASPLPCSLDNGSEKQRDGTCHLWACISLVVARQGQG